MTMSVLLMVCLLWLRQRECRPMGRTYEDAAPCGTGSSPCCQGTCRSGRWIAVEEIVLDGEERRGGPGGDVELPVDALQMPVHRLRTDAEGASRLLDRH